MGILETMLCQPGSLTPEQRRELLKKLVGEGSAVDVARRLGISRASFYRYVRGEREAPASLDPRLCGLVSEDELLAMLNNQQMLEGVGVVRGGQINVPLLLALVDAALEHPQTKEVVLKRVADRYKSELQELLSQSLPRVELRWDEGFEKWLVEKKSRPISFRTLNDYRNYWSLCLEGRTLGWHLIKQVTGKRMKCSDGEYHPTGWLRQVFRHYIRYLYSEGRIDWDTYSRLLITVPGRRYGRRLSQKVISTDDVRETLRILKEDRPDIYTLYLLIIFSGVRYEHTLATLKTWSPNEVVYVDYMRRNVRRLECLRQHCRYYVGRETDVKPAAFMFFPKELLNLIIEYRSSLPSENRIYKVVRKRGGLPGKYVRTWGMRQMLNALGDNDITRFILGKIGELSVTARHYRNLVEEADKIYPRYIKHMKEVLGDEITFDIEALQGTASRLRG